MNIGNIQISQLLQAQRAIKTLKPKKGSTLDSCKLIELRDPRFKILSNKTQKGIVIIRLWGRGAVVTQELNDELSLPRSCANYGQMKIFSRWCYKLLFSSFIG
jgi:hypothetical protein